MGSYGWGTRRASESPTARCVYCNSGARAAAAVAMLARLGFNAMGVNDNFANYRRSAQLAARI